MKTDDIPYYSEETTEDDFEMDKASYHMARIREKGLDIDPMQIYNHMAIYLRWCIKHDLMGEKFLAKYGEVVRQVKTGYDLIDLRTFIHEKLSGRLCTSLLNQEGCAFSRYYYGENDAPYYPSDVDNYALEYFGPFIYYSNQFRQEAYLFLVFEKDYDQVMERLINKRFVNWKAQYFDEDTLAPSDLAQAMIKYLDCECTYFPSMKDDDPITSAYRYARRLGVQEGFIPVLVKVDGLLWESLILNSDPDSDDEVDYVFDSKKVADYRKKMLTTSLKDGEAILSKLIDQRKKEAKKDDMDWDEEVLGKMENGKIERYFQSYWDFDAQMTYPLILARIPVKNPWELFVYLPFGNWNECPDTQELMAVTKYWFERYGAIPAVMTHDELELELVSPIAKEKAMEVAVEQYGFCPDMDQNFDELGTLADSLWQSTIWYFWWD